MSVKVSGAAPENPHQTEFIKRAPTPPAFLADITDQEIRGTKTIVFNSKAPGLAEQHTIDGKVFSDEIGASVLLNTAEEWKVVNTTNATTGPGLIDHPFHIHINPFQIVELFDPNELLVDAKGQPLVDPATKKPAVDASGNPLPKYVFDRAAVESKDLQCFIDPRGNPANWKPCDDPWGKQTNLIWWDVFPIPSGKVATDAKGNQLKDFYGQPIIIPGYFKMRSRFVDFPGLYVMHCHILAHEDRGMMAIVQVTPAKPQVTHH
jgi:FtsP/CotA-like multicopper oxidase with cupredoxin domain